MKKKYPQKTSDTDILKTAVTRFQSAQTALGAQRNQMRSDLAFVAGQQSVTNIAGTDDYEVTINLLKPFLQQVTQRARAANPAIRVVPVSSQEDTQTAEVISGLIRHIEQTSHATRAYQTALWYAAAGGEGYFQLTTDYDSNAIQDGEYTSLDTDLFNQSLRITAIDNPERVFLDPNHTDPAGTDAEWGFVVEDVDRDIFLATYPTSKTAEYVNTASWRYLQLPNDWMSDNSIRVCRYWFKEYHPRKIFLVENTITGERRVTEKPDQEIEVILNTRVVDDYVIRATHLTACEVLENTVWPGRRIPVFKVSGENFFVGGELYQSGVVRAARDAQKLYNYYQSREFEMVDQAPKNSWVITERQMGNYADLWANANRENYGALPYVREEGSPPPTRVSGLDGNSFAAILNAKQSAYESLKLVTGVTDAPLGNPGNEISGRAIEVRAAQSEQNTDQYFANLTYTLTALGQEIVAVIPVFYDTERTIRIVRPTDEEELITINGLNSRYAFDSAAKYAVSISTGPSWNTRREQTLASLTSVMSALGPDGKLIADYVVNNIDSPMSRKIAQRIRATLPPEVLAASGEGDDADLAPAAALEQAQVELSQLQTQLQKLELELQEREVENKTLRDKTLTDLAKIEHERNVSEDELAFNREKTRMEYELKMRELALKEREFDLHQRELELKALHLTHTVNETDRPEKAEMPAAPNIAIPKADHNTSLGGGLE